MKNGKTGKNWGGVGSGKHSGSRSRSNSASPPLVYKGVFEPVLKRNGEIIKDTDARLTEEDYQFITKKLTLKVINKMQSLEIMNGTGLDKKPFYSVTYRPNGSYLAYSNFPMEITAGQLPTNTTFSKNENRYKVVEWIDLSD